MIAACSAEPVEVPVEVTRIVQETVEVEVEKVVTENHQSGKVEIVFRDDTEQDRIIDAEVRLLEGKMDGHIESTKVLAEVVGVGEDDMSIFTSDDVFEI